MAWCHRWTYRCWAAGDGNSAADGRYVAFESRASDLVLLDTNNTTAIYVRDRINQLTRKVSVNDAGEAANGVSLAPSISGNGRYVAFWSNAVFIVTRWHFDPRSIRNRLAKEESEEQWTKEWNELFHELFEIEVCYNA